MPGRETEAIRDILKSLHTFCHLKTQTAHCSFLASTPEEGCLIPRGLCILLAPAVSMRHTVVGQDGRSYAVITGGLEP